MTISMTDMVLDSLQRRDSSILLMNTVHPLCWCASTHHLHPLSLVYCPHHYPPPIGFSFCFSFLPPQSTVAVGVTVLVGVWLDYNPLFVRNTAVFVSASYCCCDC